MKKGIHPNWTHEAQVTCSCGAKFKIGSIHEELKVDICSHCHPFFTGEMKFVDRQGRVDKFLKKMQVAEVIKSKVSKNKSTAKDNSEESKSYKDVLIQQQAVLKQVAKSRSKVQPEKAQKEA